MCDNCFIKCDHGNSKGNSKNFSSTFLLYCVGNWKSYKRLFILAPKDTEQDCGWDMVRKPHISKWPTSGCNRNSPLCYTMYNTGGGELI